MYELYNENEKNTSTNLNIYNNLFNKFSKIGTLMSVPFLTFLPVFIYALMQAESIIIMDLATYVGPLCNINIESADKKIRRFLKSKKNDFMFFFDKFIVSILADYKIKHSDKKIFIAFDHMHIGKRFTILLFALRIGKVGIPIWFRMFTYNHKDAFQLALFQEGVLFCHNLIKKVDSNSKIIFLADRFWGNHTKLMEYIDSLGDTFYIRTKGNLLIYIYDKKEKKYKYIPIKDLKSYVHHSNFYKNILFTKNHYEVNIAISKAKDHVEPYYIVTNADPKTAIKEYSKRFGAVEFNFKNQKSNGFFLEETQIKDLKTLEALFVCVCITQILLTILGIDHSKNCNSYRDIKITTTKIVKKKRKRLYSYFHIGLMIIKYVSKMIKPMNLFHKIILYDV